MYSSECGSPNAISAVRRTLPEMTHLPTRFIRSTIVVTESGCPLLASRTARQASCISRSGPGPDATPPKPLIGSPAGRTSE